MYTYSSDSDSLSDASIELAEHIAGKFSPSPPVRTPLERSSYKRMMKDALILPCCCDTCSLNKICENTG